MRCESRISKMEFSFILLLISATITLTSSSPLRATGSVSTHVSTDVCALLDIKTCRASKEKCIWCKSFAVPSSCIPIEHADGLPPSVFFCEFPKKVLDDASGITHYDLSDTTHERDAKVASTSALPLSILG